MSCMLFSIAMNEVTRGLPKGIGATIYVDELAIYFSGLNLPTADRLLQTSVDRISRWALQHGFWLSPQKTVGVHFHRKRGEQTDPILYLNNQQIIFKESVKFLGLILDYRLNWKNHISQLRIGCIKAMSLVRILSHFKWGADRQSLLRIYRAVIRSKIDYGSQVYGSAKPNVLKKLDPVHNMALRYCTGAFRSSPVVRVCVPSLASLPYNIGEISCYSSTTFELINTDPWGTPLLTELYLMLFHWRQHIVVCLIENCISTHRL